jgi:hypothetical protein
VSGTCLLDSSRQHDGHHCPPKVSHSAPDDRGPIKADRLSNRKNNSVPRKEALRIFGAAGTPCTLIETAARLMKALKNPGAGFLTGGSEENLGHKDHGRSASLRYLLIFCPKSE